MAEDVSERVAGAEHSRKNSWQSKTPSLLGSTKAPAKGFIALSPSYRDFITNLNKVVIPNNIQEALEIPEWRNAVMEEIRALEKNGTWEIVERPRGKKLLSCKWVFTPKYKADSTLDKLKARLVARGFTQTYGIDYKETFAPVAKLNTIRILLACGSQP
ncbi:uncharacterized mitochondrial protein AtMg00820-like [Prosopis cineraria]|uniref:uncharacterized mitochondrial protein AtMg00820-like n=1 Tax=Prosopis cineraria TaxID=364024 RepID=UPI00240EE23B|nr:uncharacterized mitochondrial protein AtMg00820-like [Prosopis cineraria]